MNNSNNLLKKKVSSRFPQWLFSALYWYINKQDKQSRVTFMNYGYSDPEESVMMDPEDEKNRYSVQLYHHLCKGVDLKGKDIVEIGCGRGGGMAYIARKYSPSSLIGIDREKSSIAFSNKNHDHHNNLSFLKGNAENIPLKDNSCDILLNVESSHRYTSMENFITGAARVIRPGGHFLFADYRYDHEWPSVIELFTKSGLKIIRSKDITTNILRALDLDSERRISLIRADAHRILKKGILKYAGYTGTETYNYFQSRVFTYKSIIFQKRDINDN